MIISRSGDLPGDFLYMAALTLVTLGDLGAVRLVTWLALTDILSGGVSIVVVDNLSVTGIVSHDK